MQPEGHPGLRFIRASLDGSPLWESPFKASGHPFVFSSSAAVSDGRVEMTIRNQGDFTGTIHTIPVGKRVYLDGPYGTFTIGDAPAPHVLIAGGVGIAPMRDPSVGSLRTLPRKRRRNRTLITHATDNSGCSHV